MLRAVQVAQQEPVKPIAGDAVASLPNLFSMIPEETTLCIFRIFTQLPPKSRDRLSSLVLEQSAKRDVFLISSRPYRGDASELWLTSFKDGTRTEKLLAYFENHGEWLEWLNADGV